jgi:hypothetical protein
MGLFPVPLYFYKLLNYFKMAISPTITACYKENNTVIQVTDTTSVYSAGNTGGYGSPNDANTTITSATILITFPDSSTQTVDVTSEINANAVTGNFVFSDITPDTNVDGIHSFLYTVVTPSGTVTYTLHKLFVGKVRCCVDKLWKDVPDKLCEECETEAFIERVHFAEGLYKSLIAMGGCYKIASINKVLTKLQTLCDFEDCNC